MLTMLRHCQGKVVVLEHKRARHFGRGRKKTKAEHSIQFLCHTQFAQGGVVRKKKNDSFSGLLEGSRVEFCLTVFMWK